MKQVAQYASGIGVGLMSAIALTLMNTFPNRWVFFGTFGIWLLALVLVGRILRQRGVHGIQLLSICDAVAIVALLLVVESAPIRWFLLLVGSLCLGALTMWGVRSAFGSWVQGKPYRRFVVAGWVFALYGVVTFLFAYLTFFPGGGWSVLILLLMGVLYGVVALIIWQQYYAVGALPLLLWSVIVGIILVELAWTMQLLPLGYTALAAQLTWIWYLLQLLIRFHLSDRGIDWKKQWPALAAHAALMTAILAFFVRWV